MKLVFKNVAEQREITDIVTNASSISNSQSLMSLVKDSVVDGSEPEPKNDEVKSTPAGTMQESMEDLKARAQELGVSVSDDDSRAGILQKIDALKKAYSGEKETEEEVETEDEGEDKKPAKSPKSSRGKK